MKSNPDKIRRFVRKVLLLAAAAAVLLASGCPRSTPDPDPQPDETGSFSWTSPDTPKESIFSMASYSDESQARSLSVVDDAEGLRIVPDTFKAAYSYIALIPKATVQDISDAGLQAPRTDSDWVRNDEYLKLDDNSLIPGYWEQRDLPYNLFEGYLDEDTPVTRQEVRDASFSLYDHTENGGALKIFDVTAGTTRLTLEDTLPPDLSVDYCGVAAELIYYEAELDGYGRMRFFFNDYPDNNAVKAGDVLVHKDSFTSGIEDGEGIWWQWIYLKHGDGPDPECFTTTCDDPGYSQVNAPNPTEDDENNWDYQDYDGLVTYDSTGPYYAFVYDSGPGDFADYGVPNQDKRPSGTGSFSYWMVENEFFNGSDPSADQLLAPDLDSAEHIGGFKNAALEPFGTYPSGWYEGDADLEPDDAFLVHHEADYHEGVEDRTHAVYFDTRQEVISRNEFLKRYGWYGYDSGLLSRIYDDSQLSYGTSSSGDPFDPYKYSEKVIINPLHFAMGRMQVYADAPGDRGGENYSDSWFDRIISLEIELQLDAELRLETDNGTGTLEERFLTFIPDWNLSNPTARPYSFNGNDDLHKPPIKLMIIPGRFQIRHEYRHYSDLYTLPPTFTPDPAEGPFAASVSVSLYNSFGDKDYNDRMRFFYTLDGSDPAVTEGDLRWDSLTPGVNTYGYTGPIQIAKSGDPVTVRAVAYEQRTGDLDEMKKQSIIKECVYAFTAPGHSLQLNVTKNGAAAGEEVFAGLFSTEEIDLNCELSPLYYAFGKIAGGGCVVTLIDVPPGNYHLAVIIDRLGEGAGELSPGDHIYPVQSPHPSSSYVLKLEPVSIPGVGEKNVTVWTDF
jgi:hypothetical protein